LVQDHKQEVYKVQKITQELVLEEVSFQVVNQDVAWFKKESLVHQYKINKKSKFSRILIWNIKCQKAKSHKKEKWISLFFLLGDKKVQESLIECQEAKSLNLDQASKIFTSIMSRALS
jgi:hypothetical protein